MKNGTAYAAKLKRAFTKLRQTAPTAKPPETDEIVRCLAVSILGVGCSHAEAERAISRALKVMVDWNEIRVSTAAEVNRATGNSIPKGTQRCKQLIDALQSIFYCENSISLDRLRSMGRREARHYLEALNGVDEYAVASVLLWGLGGHAIPVNDKLLSLLRSADLVNPTADRAEVQAFLERHVNAASAQEFCLVMQSLSPTKRPAAKRTRAKSVAKKKSVSRSK